MMMSDRIRDTLCRVNGSGSRREYMRVYMSPLPDGCILVGEPESFSLASMLYSVVPCYHVMKNAPVMPIHPSS